MGFNLKPLDPQAAIGRVQLKRLTHFIEVRKQNWNILRKGLACYEDLIEFSLPTHATKWSSQGLDFSWDNMAADPIALGLVLRSLLSPIDFLIEPT